jgi:hypothetical protein
MSRATADILADIQAFPPPTDILRGWRPLAELVAELEAADGLPDAIPDLLRYFERYPTARLVGWLWDVARAIEARPGQYEAAVLESIRRCPSDFGVRLAGRFAARGKPQIGAVRVVDALEDAARQGDLPEALRETIRWIVQSCCRLDAGPDSAPAHDGL